MQSPQRYPGQGQQLRAQTAPLAQQAPLSAEALSSGAAVANVFGPALSRTRASDGPAIAAERAALQARVDAAGERRAAAERAALAAEWEASHRPPPRAAFYNTREGDALISAARADLSARAKPVERAPAHLNSVQQNCQRVYHGECVLAQNLAELSPGPPPPFAPYPLQEYNRFNSQARTWSGPDVAPRLKSVPYRAKEMDVPRRHDLVKNLRRNRSISNYDHGLPFLAKHTNNLVSC